MNIFFDTVFMKKFLALLVAIAFTVSCSLDDGEKEFTVEFLPTISVQAPEYVVAGQTAYFTVNYRRPTDCHYVNGFYYQIDGAIRTVAVQSIIIEESECNALDTQGPESRTLNFECPPVLSVTSYLFKFYQGVNPDTGEDLYLEIEVPVHQQ
jgi:hypothetical protein